MGKSGTAPSVAATKLSLELVCSRLSRPFDAGSRCLFLPEERHESHSTMGGKRSVIEGTGVLHLTWMDILTGLISLDKVKSYPTDPRDWKAAGGCKRHRRRLVSPGYHLQALLSSHP